VAETAGGDDAVTIDLSSLNNADGGVVIMTGADDDTVTLTADGGAQDINLVIDGGSGEDTLALTEGSDFTGAGLNMTDTGFEILDISGAGATVASSDFSGMSMTLTGDGYLTSTLTVDNSAGGAVDVSGLVASDSATTGAKIAVTGGASANTVTLGASTEIFTQADQSLSAVGTEVAEGTAGLDDGDFITFAEGVDTINNFAALDLIGTAGTGTLATDSSGTFDVDAEAFGIADNGYAIIAGTMDAETGVFTADAEGSDTLFAYDSDGTATQDIEFVVLVGVDAGTTDLADIVFVPVV